MVGTVALIVVPRPLKGTVVEVELGAILELAVLFALLVVLTDMG